MLQEADFGLTDSAFNANGDNRYANDDRLLVRFLTHPRQNPTKSAEAGRPIFEDTVYVEIMQPGNKDSIIMRPATDRDKSRFAEHYRKFQAREDQESVTGTLLSEWPGVTRSQVEELKFLNVRTVEQLASLNDAHAQNIMGVNMLKQKAVKYLESARGDEIINELKEAKAQIAALTARLDAAAGGEIDGETIEGLDVPVTRRRRAKAD